MADIDLPVFSFAPNWADGIIETLEWQTDVLSSYMGHEQRRKLRLTPRRFFEADFNPVGNARSFMSLWLQRFAEQEFLMPLWHDRAKLTSDVAIGATRVEFDNTFREHEANPGLALIRRGDFDYEVIDVSGQDDTGLDLAAATAKEWPTGTAIYPLRPAVFDSPAQAAAALTSRVGQAGLAFRGTRSNPYVAGAEVLGVYAGYPVIVKAPNRQESLRVANARRHEDLDNQTGRVYRRDEAGRAFAQQSHDWRAVGRQQHHELRQTLYRLEGRQKAVWLPTFNEDAIVTADVATGANTITIGEIGYGFLGGPTSGRQHLFFKDATGTPQIVEVTSVASASLEDGAEVLTLSANVAFDIDAGTPMSFVELMRLDQDAVEITHYTDTDGVCDAAAAFRAFRDGRTTAGNLIQPAVVATKTAESCGSPGSGEDSPCLQTFAGWYYKVTLDMPGNASSIGSGSLIMWLNSLAGTQQYSGSFYTDGNGEFNPARVAGNSHQFQRAADSSFVNLYVHGDRGDIREVEIQMQQLGGGSTSTPPFVNTLSFQQWDQSAQGPLPTIQSVFISPGQDSDEGNGLIQFPRAGNFPDNHFFAV